MHFMVLSFRMIAGVPSGRTPLDWVPAAYAAFFLVFGAAGFFAAAFF
jgi:hypothetical protein